MPEAAGSSGLVTFRLGGRSFGLSLSRVVEILRMVAVTSVPEAPEWLLGVVDVRGSHIPVIDLRSRLGIEAPPPDPASRIIVVESQGRVTGLVVDEVSEVVTDEGFAIETIENIRERVHPIAGVARIGTATVVILKVDEVARGLDDLDLPEDLDAVV